jgi:hypothetical protein
MDVAKSRHPVMLDDYKIALSKQIKKMPAPRIQKKIE